ncbi:MAG: hypothetical protein XD46_1292 [Euryarchaeota archaeon 55_53]|nr:MAG: hypothetical protein XD46_1292 [Euryarchaeota archaeon 55_53]
MNYPYCRKGLPASATRLDPHPPRAQVPFGETVSADHVWKDAEVSVSTLIPSVNEGDFPPKELKVNDLLPAHARASKQLNEAGT